MSANAFIAGYTRLLSPIHGSDAEDKLYDEQSQQEDQSSWPVHAVEVDHIRLRQRRCHDIHQRTDQYFANATSPVSPRPTNSALDLTKITETGYTPANWEETLKTYVEKELGR